MLVVGQSMQSAGKGSPRARSKPSAQKQSRQDKKRQSQVCNGGRSSPTEGRQKPGPPDRAGKQSNMKDEPGGSDPLPSREQAPLPMKLKSSTLSFAKEAAPARTDRRPLKLDLLLEVATRLATDMGDEQQEQRGLKEGNQNWDKRQLERNEDEEQERPRKRNKVLLADLNGVPPDELDDNDLEKEAKLELTENQARTSEVLQATNVRNGGAPGAGASSCTADTRGEPTESEVQGIGQELRGREEEIVGPEAKADNDSPASATASLDKQQLLRAALTSAARKLPLNAHAQFLLGLLQRRSNAPDKAAAAFGKAEEAMQATVKDESKARADLSLLIRCQQLQCSAEANFVGKHANKEAADPALLAKAVKELKEDIPAGHCMRPAVWNDAALLLLQAGNAQLAAEELTALVQAYPAYVDALANLGVAEMRCGRPMAARKCFEEALLRDPKHLTALASFGVLLLSKDGCFAGGGAGPVTRLHAAEAAQRCLEQAVREEPGMGGLWVTLAAAYSANGKLQQAKQCLDEATRLMPNSPVVCYAIAAHRLQGAEQADDPARQLALAATEMASLLKDHQSTPENGSEKEGCCAIPAGVAWGGLAMVHKAQAEAVAMYEEEGEMDSQGAEQQASQSLQQAVEVNPRAPVPWHQLGVHKLTTLQFEAAQKCLRTSISHRSDFPAAWSNLGIALQLGEEPGSAEEVYKRALELSSPLNAHTVLNNLANLYRQQRRFEEAHEAFERCFTLCPEYAPAWNNLGLLLIAEGRWMEAVTAFDHALASDHSLDAAKSNRMKILALLKMKEEAKLCPPPAAGVPEATGSVKAAAPSCRKLIVRIDRSKVQTAPG